MLKCSIFAASFALSVAFATAPAFAIETIKAKVGKPVTISGICNKGNHASTTKNYSKPGIYFVTLSNGLKYRVVVK